MRCPTLAELPPPPEGKSGWPWTEETPQLPDAMPDGKPWPKVSIVTPSFNQGEFIEETIRSILLQGYLDLEYIIMDGGSTDRSVDIIKKYEKYISRWESQPDNGQADAIARGFEIAAGDILAYINSDDYYLSDTFVKVANAFQDNPSAQWVTSSIGLFINSQGKVILKKQYPKVTTRNMIYLGNCINQPSTFWKRSLYIQSEGINTNMQFSFDFDLFLKFTGISDPIIIPDILSAFRFHESSKSCTISHIGVTEGKEIRSKCIQADDEIILKFLYMLKGWLYRKKLVVFDLFNPKLP